jgi:hypothetical protein
MHVKVGEIQSYDVMYVPEKDMVFCKNTICRVSDLKKAIKSPLGREYIEEKDLSIVKDNGIIYFGCLTTTKQNVLEIEQEINKIKKSKK